MSYANVVLTKEALATILAANKVYNLKLSGDDIKELKIAHQYAYDKEQLEKNAVKTPLKFYK